MSVREVLDEDPLAPDNPLASVLVDVIRDLSLTRRLLESAEVDAAAYRVLAQTAMSAHAAAVVELDQARRTIARLRDEISKTRVGIGEIRTAA